MRAERRVVALLSRFFADADDRRHEVDRLLQLLDASSATLQPSLFPRPGRRASLSAFVEGFSLHAATRVLASNRRGLWRLCAYGARGAQALSRLSELPDGRFAWDMKRPLPDGRSRLAMTGVELIERIVPLIPPVYANLTPCAAVGRRARKPPRGLCADKSPAREGCPPTRATTAATLFTRVTDDDTLGDLWARLAEKRGARTVRVAPEQGRPVMLLPREQRDGPSAKAAAVRLAREIIEACAAKRPRTALVDDVAEAIVVGAWAARAEGAR